MLPFFFFLKTSILLYMEINTLPSCLLITSHISFSKKRHMESTFSHSNVSHSKLLWPLYSHSSKKKKSNNLHLVFIANTHQVCKCIIRINFQVHLSLSMPSVSRLKFFDTDESNGLASFPYNPLHPCILPAVFRLFLWNVYSDCFTQQFSKPKRSSPRPFNSCTAWNTEPKQSLCM